MNNAILKELEDLVSDAKLVFTVLEQESVKFGGGNKAAGSRTRKAALELTHKLKAIRAKVSEAKNS